MEKLSLIVSVLGITSTIVGFITILFKMGREKGESDTLQREIRKDIDQNAKDINCLGQKVNKMEIENTKLISTLSSDLGWIKSSLSDIKAEISKTK